MAGKNNREIQEIINNLPYFEKRSRKVSDILLANLVMISEVPAPTFREEERMRFLVNRLTEFHLHNCSTDEMGNALAILPGKEGKENILLVAHLDTLFDETVDHTITVQPDRVLGPGVGDNAVGLSVLATLPLILDSLKIKLRSNLIFMGCARSLERGNLQGIRFFLENTTVPINAGICLDGNRLGTLSYNSLGMMSCEIHFHVPKEYDWSKFEAVGGITTINEVINRILSIPLPRKPRTGIVLGSLEAGSTFHIRANRAVLRLQIRSEEPEMVETMAAKLRDIVAEVSSETQHEGELNIVAQRNPGGIPFSHPLVYNARQILESLEIKPQIIPNTGELSAFIDSGIPAIAIGITKGENMDQLGDIIEINPIYKGIAQLIGIILAIDRGCCHES